MNLEDKRKQIKNVSNPFLVYQKAKLLLNDDFVIDISTRVNKKYMIKSKFTKNKWVHFGDIRYMDYTKHQNDEKKNRFKLRNSHWLSDYEKYSPSWFSYNLLW